jgi:D-alanine-D-alanine ligase
MNGKVRVGILCGGMSSEHEISCISASGVMGAIDRNRFEPILIGITKTGKWVLPPHESALKMTERHMPEISSEWPTVNTDVAGFSCNGETLNLDVVFPLLHGPYGEDGTVQGLLEMAAMKYVGSGVLASAVAMDKSFAKSIFTANGLEVADGIVIHEREWNEISHSKVLKAAENLGLPLFVKPARSGSSRGTYKVKRFADLESAVTKALEFDTKVLVEKAIVGREIECAVLQTRGEVLASPVGEIVILGSHEFYDFEAKYLDNSTRVDFPTDLPRGVSEKIREAAITAFNVLGCEGLARVDFFYSKSEGIIINEINTMPGFTATSVYPKLWGQSGLTYANLLTKLINSALDRPLGVTR